MCIRDRIFTGKSLVIGGSRQISPLDNNIFTGDISAVLIKNLPIWARFFRTPSMNIALMSEWENKIEQMAMVTSKQNVTSISGVPTWTIVLIKRILKLKMDCGRGKIYGRFIIKHKHHLNGKNHCLNTLKKLELNVLAHLLMSLLSIF